LRLLWRQPFTLLVRRWHWKAAILSACLRGSLFFLATLKAGLAAALAALGVEAALFAVVSGFYGALIQHFRHVQPAWQATLLLMVALPACNHALEFTVHRLSGTPHLARGIALSICFSMLSACFNLFAMRRGVLLIGDERRRLRDDLRALPRVVWQFITAVPRALLQTKR
jgi:putative exporter of polyketide antibiotics